MFMGGLLHVPYTPHDSTTCSPFTSRSTPSMVLNASVAQLPPRTLAFLRLGQS